MHILEATTLETIQKEQILALESLVFSYEVLENHVFLSSEMNSDKEMPSFFLCYEDQKLVSFLGAFFPTIDEVEFNGFTHPKHRRQGYFSALVHRALEVYARGPFTRALFQRELQSKTGQEYLLKRYPEIERTEYLMQLSSEQYKDKDTSQGTLELVDKNNVEQTTELTSLTFEEFLQNSVDILQYYLSQTDRKTFLYRSEGKAIGILNAQKIDDSFMLHGVVIAKEQRNQGKGYAMLSLALSELFKEARCITLEVDSENPPALALYKRLGFCVKCQVDYHRHLLR